MGFPFLSFFTLLPLYKLQLKILCHPMLPFLFRMHLSWQKLLGQYDKPWRRLDVCSHSCSICTFQGRNPLGGQTNLSRWGVTGFRIVLNIGQFSESFLLMVVTLLKCVPARSSIGFWGIHAISSSILQDMCSHFCPICTFMPEIPWADRQIFRIASFETSEEMHLTCPTQPS